MTDFISLPIFCVFTYFKKKGINMKWKGLLSIFPAIAIVFLDQTILPVALPSIQKDLQGSFIALQWCVNSYLLAISMFVLAAGKISDRVGHRRTFILGMIVFGFFSILCGLSQNLSSLIAYRFLQGVGSALIFPSQSALIAALFPANERGRASGLIVSISSVFLILGPLFGGYFAEALTWRWIFWINIPIVVIGIFTARLFLPYTLPTKQKTDYIGFLLFALFACTLVILFMESGNWGWISLRSLLCVSISALSFIFLLLREKKNPHPFLDLALFKRPIFAAITISVAITQFIIMINVFRSIYFQTVLHYSPLQTGLITFISCLPVLFFSSIGGYLADKISPKLPIALGFCLLIFSFVWLAIFSTPSLPLLIIGLLPFGMGIPLIFTPSYSTAMSAVAPQKLGVAFGMVSTCRTFSASFGVALIALLMTLFENRFQSEPKSFSATHLTLAILLTLAFISVLFLHKRKPSHHLPNSPAEGWD
jgi:EmrB/QacA subfamily drug resistance transporter